MNGEPIPPHCSDPMFLHEMTRTGQPLPPECQKRGNVLDLLKDLFAPNQPAIQVPPNTIYTPTEVEGGVIHVATVSDEIDTTPEIEDEPTTPETTNGEGGGEESEEDDTEKEESDKNGEIVEESRWSELAEKGKKGLMYAGGISIIGIGIYIYSKQKR